MCVLYVSFFFTILMVLQTTYFVLSFCIARVQPYINTIHQSIQCLCALSCWPQITSLRLSHKNFKHKKI